MDIDYPLNSNRSDNFLPAEFAVQIFLNKTVNEYDKEILVSEIIERYGKIFIKQKEFFCDLLIIYFKDNELIIFGSVIKSGEKFNCRLNPVLDIFCNKKELLDSKINSYFGYSLKNQEFIKNIVKANQEGMSVLAIPK